MTQHFRPQKSRHVVGATEPAEPKTNFDGESLGFIQLTQIDRAQQDAVMYRAGYDEAFERFMPRILELEDQLRYYIKHSVAQMFGDLDFDGADSARRRSAERFRHWYENQRERDAA